MLKLEGLTADQVRLRRTEFGPNRLSARERGVSVGAVLARQFDNPLLILLTGAGWLSLLMGEPLDAAVILGTIGASVGLGFLQEYKAARTLEALKKLVSPRAWVLRAGKRRQIAAADVVPDDLLLLAAGDKIAADGTVIAAEALEINESALTGESYGIGKTVRDQAAAGTVVVRGTGVVRVSAIGDATAMGRIAHLTAETGAETTPLEHNLHRLARQLSYLLGTAAGLILIVAILQGRPLTETLVAAIALAVAVIPEGLPIMVTVMLAAGMERLARRNASVRRLAAVETLGSVTVAAVDKTGTLTSGELRVAEVIGFRPSAAAGADPEEVIRIALLASEVGRTTLASADPLETALAAHGRELGLVAETLQRRHRRLNAIPFDPQRRLMATLVTEADRPLLVVKGAPEVVLPACRLSAKQRGGLTKTIARLAGAGLRVIAVARKKTQELERELPRDLTLVGLIGFIDPPREGAAAALAALAAAGIRPLMITGDHPATARRIAEELGMSVTANTILTGAQLRRLTPRQRADRLRRITVAARVLPEEKLLIVEALQKSGAVVAMTGDGVNDGPALKAADIGVALGRSGTEVAKETADLVLLDDSLQTIVAAVEEGRTIVRNLRKGLLYLLGTNLAELLLIVGAIALGWPLPLTATQILWINLVTDTFPVVGLAFEAAPGMLKRGPTPARAPLLTPFLLRRALVMGVTMAATGLWLFAALGGAASGATLLIPQTVAFMALAVWQLINTFTVRSLENFRLPWQHLRWPLLITLGAGLGLQLLATTAFASFLKTAPLPTAAWTLILFLAALIVMIVELHKLLERIWRQR